MSHEEFVDWMAFARLHPFGEPVEWSRHGRLSQLLYALLAGKGSPSRSIDDFIPDFGSDT